MDNGHGTLCESCQDVFDVLNFNEVSNSTKTEDTTRRDDENDCVETSAEYDIKDEPIIDDAAFKQDSNDIVEEWETLKEDTDDASESENYQNAEYTEMKEEMYQDKLAQLKKQLQQLKEGIHPEWIKR